MKKLYIIRHGDSPIANDISDFERPLSEFGMNDAQKMGKYIKSNCTPLPSLIISSAANRALTTAKIIAKEIDFKEFDIIAKQELHNANMSSVLNEITNAPQNSDNLLIFGHNPGLSQLASYLSGEYLQMDTCNMIVLSTDIENWNELTGGICSILDFITP